MKKIIISLAVSLLPFLVFADGLGPQGGSSSGGGGSGTVTGVSVVTGNGLSGSVANPTTTPAITMSTTVTGLVKGNGTALSAATAGTDYQAPVSLTTTGSSGAATLIANTLNIPTPPAINTGTPGQVVYYSGASTLSGVSTSGTGNVALTTSPAFTTPIFSSIVNTGTLTLPTSTDTLVGRATTDTLTNKSIAGSEINSGTVLATYLPTATSSAFGIVEPDNSTITITGGVLTAAKVSGGAAGTIYGGATPSFSATPTLGVNATTSGTLGFANGNTSGTTILLKGTQATTAGIIFNLPATNGTSGYVLETDGSGNTSWIAAPSPAFVASSGTATAGGTTSAAFGPSASAAGTSAVAIGNLSSASTGGAVAIGLSSTASASFYPVAIGAGATASGTFYPIAIGNSATAAANYGIAIGEGSWVKSSAASAIAIGNTATASNNNSVVIGNSLSDAAANEILIGSSSQKLYIKNNGSVNVPSDGDLIHVTATLTAGSTANTPTMTSGPVTGNPTKWIPIDDNGTTRYIPAW